MMYEPTLKVESKIEKIWGLKSMLLLTYDVLLYRLYSPASIQDH